MASVAEGVTPCARFDSAFMVPSFLLTSVQRQLNKTLTRAEAKVKQKSPARSGGEGIKQTKVSMKETTRKEIMV